MDALSQLLQITAFGRPLFAGSFFKIKYRKQTTATLEDDLKRLKNKYPELLVYKADTGYTIFGGTFSSKSNLLYEIKLVVGRR